MSKKSQRSLAGTEIVMDLADCIDAEMAEQNPSPESVSPASAGEGVTRVRVEDHRPLAVVAADETKAIAAKLNETTNAVRDSLCPLIERIRALEADAERLRGENEALVDALDSAMRQGCEEVTEGTVGMRNDLVGYFDTMAISCWREVGDRLVDAGAWEIHPEGFGRRWFYRPKAKDGQALASERPAEGEEDTDA